MWGLYKIFLVSYCLTRFSYSEIAWLCGGIRSSRGRHARLVISHVVVPYHSAAHKTLHFVASRLKPDRLFFSKTQNYAQNLNFLTNGKKTPKIPDFIKKRAKYGQEWPKKCQNGENKPKITDFKNNMSTLRTLYCFCTYIVSGGEYRC